MFCKIIKTKNYGLFLAEEGSGDRQTSAMSLLTEKKLTGETFKMG